MTQGPGGDAAERRVRLYLLGGFRVERDGQVLPDTVWVRRSASTLVKLLATEPSHRLHREQLADLLWPDLGPEAAQTNLRRAIHYARQALDRPGEVVRSRRGDLHTPDQVPSDSSCLRMAGDMVVLAVGEGEGLLWIDADAYEALATAALQADDRERYEAALAMYGGELLPEERYADWATTRRQSLVDLHLTLLERLSALLERAGERHAAVERLQEVLQRDATREDVHRRLMRLYIHLGSRHAALRQYHVCREALRRELDAEPEAETLAVYREILMAAHGEPATLRLNRRMATGGGLRPPLPSTIARAPVGPFLGRERTLRALQVAMGMKVPTPTAEAREGQGDAGAPGRSAALERSTRPYGLLLIGGEAGVGKTRLAIEMARTMHQQGWIVLWGQGHEGGGHAPYAPFVDALEGCLAGYGAADREVLAATYPELARLLPALASHARAEHAEHMRSGILPPPMTTEGERARLFAAAAGVLYTLSAGSPVLLVLDDLHAADSASLQLLHHLVQVHGSRFMVQRDMPSQKPEAKSPTGSGHVLDRHAGSVRLDMAHGGPLPGGEAGDAGGRLVIVGTVRDEDVVPGSPVQQLLLPLTHAESCYRVELRGLTRDASDHLVRSLLERGAQPAPPAASWESADATAAKRPGAPVSTSLLDRLYALSLGNPLFLVQLVRALQEGGKIGLADGHWLALDDAFASGAYTVQPRVQELVGLRVDRLGEDVRRVLELASVAGSEITFPVLQRAAQQAYDAGLTDSGLLDALDITMRARVLEEHGHGYRFRHPLLRAALYDRMARQRRRHLHRALAAAIELERPEDVEALAYHYLEAGDGANAVIHLEEAGDRARAVYANEAAESRYRELMAQLHELGRLVDEARAREKLGAVLTTMSRYDKALEVLARAAQIYEARDELEGVARVAAQTGRLHRHRGTAAEGLALVESVLRHLGGRDEGDGRLRGTPSPSVMAALHLALSHLLHAVGQWEESLTAAEVAAELVRPEAEPGAGRDLDPVAKRLLADAECRCGTAVMMMEHSNRSIPILQRAVAHAEDAGDDDLLAMALNNLAQAHADVGELHPAETYLQRALTIAERMGDAAIIGYRLSNLAGVLQSLGRWSEARAHNQRAVDVFRTIGSSWYAAYPLGGLGYLTFKAGDVETGAEYIREGIAIAERGGNPQAYCRMHRHMAEIEMYQGRPEDAIRRLQALRERVDARHELATLARAYLEVGALAEAQIVVDEAVPLVRSNGVTGELAQTLHVKGLVLTRRGRYEEAEASLQEALAIARSAPYPCVEAIVLHALGLLHVARDEREPAQRHLEAALILFRRLDDRIDASQVEADLARLTARFQKSDVESGDLSDVEWARVAPLVAAPRGGRGRPRVDDRAILNGVLWVVRGGARWQDVPPRYGAPATCWRRWRTWQESGVWERICRELHVDSAQVSDDQDHASRRTL